MNSNPIRTSNPPQLVPQAQRVDCEQAQVVPTSRGLAGTHIATEVGKPGATQPEATRPIEQDSAVRDLIAAALDRAARAATPPQPAPELPRARNGFD